MENNLGSDIVRTASLGGQEVLRLGVTNPGRSYAKSVRVNDLLHACNNQKGPTLHALQSNTRDISSPKYTPTTKI